MIFGGFSSLAGSRNVCMNVYCRGGGWGVDTDGILFQLVIKHVSSVVNNTMRHNTVGDIL